MSEQPQQNQSPTGPAAGGKACHKCGGRLLEGRTNCLQCGAVVPGTATSAAGEDSPMNTTVFAVVGILVVAGILFVLVSQFSGASHEISAELTAESVSVSMSCVDEDSHDQINRLIDQGYEETASQGGQRCFVREGQ